MNKYKVAFLIPTFNEEKTIFLVIDELICNINKSSRIKDYIIYVLNDGSKDNTLSVVNSINNKRVKILTPIHKMGQSYMLDLGFKNVPNDIDLVFTIDADNQDDSSFINDFINKIEDGYDLVIGYKYNRMDSKKKIFESRLYNFIINKTFNTNLHDQNNGFKCMKKPVSDSLHLKNGYHRFISVLSKHNGFKVGEIKVNHRRRCYGKSKYGWGRVFNFIIAYIKVFLLVKIIHKKGGK